LKSEHVWGDEDALQIFARLIKSLLSGILRENFTEKKVCSWISQKRENVFSPQEEESEVEKCWNIIHKLWGLIKQGDAKHNHLSVVVGPQYKAESEMKCFWHKRRSVGGGMRGRNWNWWEAQHVRVGKKEEEKPQKRKLNRII
jgi:hypothetical protein